MMEPLNFALPPLPRQEPLIKVDRIGWVIFDKPDLGRVQPFLEDFGLIPAEASPEGQLFRGAGPSPYLYLARPAEKAGFVGSGWLAARRDDLEALSNATGQPIEKLDRPGGGECVRLTDPGGFIVEVAFGIEEVAPLPFRSEPLPTNTPFAHPRVNAGQRPPREPAVAYRLGHCVLQTHDFVPVANWYMRHLGLIPSDVQCLDDGQPALAFLRCDRGDELADHHALALGFGFSPEFMHCAFEVIDLDSIGQGNQVMQEGGWDHSWGIGRHILGSQLFDYWRDPDGHEMEHYADGDVFDASFPTGYYPLGREGIWQWGEDIPKDFGPKPSLALLRDIIHELRSDRLSFTTLLKLGRAMKAKPRSWLR